MTTREKKKICSFDRLARPLTPEVMSSGLIRDAPSVRVGFARAAAA